MRTLLLILTAIGFLAVSQGSFASGDGEGATDLSSEVGNWGRQKDTISKNVNQAQVKALVNDLLGDFPQGSSEEKSFRQSDSAK